MRDMFGLGEREATIMELLWSATEPVTVRDVLDRLERPLAYTTVMTVLDNLHNKGHVTREKSGGHSSTGPPKHVKQRRRAWFGKSWPPVAMRRGCSCTSPGLPRPRNPRCCAGFFAEAGWHDRRPGVDGRCRPHRRRRAGVSGTDCASFIATRGCAGNMARGSAGVPCTHHVVRHVVALPACTGHQRCQDAGGRLPERNRPALILRNPCSAWDLTAPPHYPGSGRGRGDSEPALRTPSPCPSLLDAAGGVLSLR